MNDVSCRAIRKFIRKAKSSGISEDALLDGLPYERRHLTSFFRHIDWATFERFSRQLERQCGGPQAMMDLCLAETLGPFARLCASLSSWVISPPLLFLYLRRVLLPANYPGVNFRVRQLPGDRVEVTMRAPEHAGDCRAALHLGVGCFRVATRWIGHPDAEVEAEFHEREAIYRVLLPPDRSLPSRLARSWSIFFSGKAAARILGRQADELKAGYAHLDRVRRELERQVATATHTEQRRIAADLNERVGGRLRKLKAEFASLGGELAAISPNASREARDVCREIETASALTHDLASGLDPISTNGGSLRSVLREFANSTSKLRGVSCEFHDIGAACYFDHAASVHLYRLAQEAIGNAIRHGHARNLHILLASAKDVVSLTITDDGRGIGRLSRQHDGRGTKIMQYRATMIGGELRIESEPGRGTSVSCLVATGNAGRELPQVGFAASSLATKLPEMEIGK